MPPGTMEGSYEIRDMDAKGVGYLYEGKIITDKTFGYATYGCAECCVTGSPGCDSFDILDNPAYGTVGGGYQFTAWATNRCSGSYDLVTGHAWSSSDTSVATIDYTYGNMSYLGAGTTTLSASSRLASVNDCCCRPQTFTSSATATIQIPDHLIVQSDTIATLNCSNGGTREDRKITYEAVDSAGRQILYALISKEQFTNLSQNSCGGLITNTTCTFGNGVGLIPDELNAGCSSPPDTTCGFTADQQQWLWCAPNGSSVLLGTPGALQVFNTNISVGGNSTGFVLGTIVPK